MTQVEDRPRRAEPTRPRRRWRMPWMSAMFAGLLVMGVMINQYPTVASWVSQYYQSQLIMDVTGQIREPDVKIAAAIDRAHAYNELLVSGGLVPANTNKPTAQASRVGEYDYRDLLNATDTGVMGRLRVPSIEVDLPIYHGTDDETLTKGIGHLEGTSLPVGGFSQHSVLTAHRGLPEATLFNDLDRVVIGDTFVVEVFGEVLTYQVVDTQVVDPGDSQAIVPVYGRDLVTLVTCTPLGINTHRILVTGERVTPTPAKDLQEAGQRPDIPGFPWWAVYLSAALVLAIGYVWRSGYAEATAAARRAMKASDPGR